MHGGPGHKTDQVFPKTVDIIANVQRKRIGSNMRSFVTKGRIIALLVSMVLFAATFVVGARHGYQLGFQDGENRANSWWIDKKSRYYESAEIKKKRITMHHNQV